MVSTGLPERLNAVAARYDREYRREAVEVPESVEALPIFQDWVAGKLSARLASPFWEMMKPQKLQNCLDLGCGGSFLFYPCWREWDARFFWSGP